MIRTGVADDELDGLKHEQIVMDGDHQQRHGSAGGDDLMGKKPQDKLKDQGLIFVFSIMTLMVGSTGISAYFLKPSTTDDNWLAFNIALGIILIVGIIALIGMWMYYRHVEGGQLATLKERIKELKRENEQERETFERKKKTEIDELQSDLGSRDQKIEELKAQIITIEGGPKPIEIITKRDYGRLLQEWNASLTEDGKNRPGEVLLYNIELQSFQTHELMEQTWGGLKHLEHIKRVVLLLPPEKIRRFERVVRRERDQFFKDPANRKFQVSEIHGTEQESPEARKATEGVAFAMYRYLDEELNASAGLHNKSVVFMLAEPFSKLMPSIIPGDESMWWDYHHILCFDGDERIMDQTFNIWREHFVANEERDIARSGSMSLMTRAIEPSELLDSLGTDEDRKTELLEHFAPRKVDECEPMSIPTDEGEGNYSITYDNGQTIEGHYHGVDTDQRRPKRPLVWVGGFTERQTTKLPDLFKRHLKHEDIIQFFYEVSPALEDITLSRYMQDMHEALRYVNNQQAVVQRDQLVLVARSINGLLAPLVAAKNDKVLSSFAGVILVAPVFDIFDMIDNYRKMTGKSHVTVEKCWRCAPGYNAHLWEDEAEGWLEFFGHHVNLTLMADIIRHDPATFCLDNFIEAVGKISHHCPIYILSHPNDPVTGSERAIAELNKATGGLGIINDQNYECIEIESMHLTPEQVTLRQYPFAVKSEIQTVRSKLLEIIQKVGLPTLPLDDPDPEPDVVVEARSPASHGEKKRAVE
ncbi:MAG: hypothetical protein O7G85_04795 [Planctomycetota bacterium]|nr:hypothetical protein [Planctomycetota bacterium]